MGTEKVSILVIDDDAAIRALLRTLMERTGAEVECAADGSDGLARLRSRFWSVVILDLMMHGTDGFQVLQTVSESTPRQLKRFIVLTAASQAMLSQLRHASRVWRVIRKPFDMHDLLRCVADCAAQRGSQVEIAPQPRSFVG